MKKDNILALIAAIIFLVAIVNSYIPFVSSEVLKAVAYIWLAVIIIYVLMDRKRLINRLKDLSNK